MANFRNATASVGEALRDFRWIEYRPFAWIMIGQLLFVFLASNLGTSWGMGGAGWIMRTGGEPAVHYPASFIFLSFAYARVESFLFAFAGSFLIPLSLARIEAPMAGIPATSPEVSRSALRAYPVVLVGYLLNFAILLAWEIALQAGPRRWIHRLLGGLTADLLTWAVGILVAFSIAAIFLYVPVRAVERGTTFGDALWGGIREGLRSFGPSLFIVLVFVWPTLIFLAPIQLRPTVLVSRFRPELIAILLAIAAVLNSFVNYLIYSAAARYHWLAARRDA